MRLDIKPSAPLVGFNRGSRNDAATHLFKKRDGVHDPQEVVDRDSLDRRQLGSRERGDRDSALASVSRERRPSLHHDPSGHHRRGALSRPVESPAP